MSEEDTPKITIDLKEYLDRFQATLLTRVEEKIDDKFRDCSKACVFAIDWFGNPFANPPIPGWREKLKTIWMERKARQRSRKRFWAKVVGVFSLIGGLIGVLKEFFNQYFNTLLRYIGWAK